MHKNAQRTFKTVNFLTNETHKLIIKSIKQRRRVQNPPLMPIVVVDTQMKYVMSSDSSMHLATAISVSAVFGPTAAQSLQEAANKCRKNFFLKIF